MVLLQHKLNVKLSQKQILTPGLVQMVSVLALNKLELKDMINAEMVENPVLDELETEVPLLDEVAGKEVEKDRLLSTEAPRPKRRRKTRSTRSTSAPTSRIIWIPATAAPPPKWWRSPPSRISCPRRPRSPIT